MKALSSGTFSGLDCSEICMSSEELRSELYVATRENVHTRCTRVLFFTLSDDFNLKVEQDVQCVKSTDRHDVLTYR